MVHHDYHTKNWIRVTYDRRVCYRQNGSYNTLRMRTYSLEQKKLKLCRQAAANMILSYIFHKYFVTLQSTCYSKTIQ